MGPVSGSLANTPIRNVRNLQCCVRPKVSPLAYASTSIGYRGALELLISIHHFHAKMLVRTFALTAAAKDIALAPPISGGPVVVTVRYARK
jgi:hypothetical protein